MSLRKLIQDNINLDKIAQENMQFREQFFSEHPTANIQEFKRYIKKENCQRNIFFQCISRVEQKRKHFALFTFRGETLCQQF